MTDRDAAFIDIGHTVHGAVGRAVNLTVSLAVTDAVWGVVGRPIWVVGDDLYDTVWAAAKDVVLNMDQS